MAIGWSWHCLMPQAHSEFLDLFRDLRATYEIPESTTRIHRRSIRHATSLANRHFLFQSILLRFHHTCRYESPDILRFRHLENLDREKGYLPSKASTSTISRPSLSLAGGRYIKQTSVSTVSSTSVQRVT